MQRPRSRTPIRKSTRSRNTSVAQRKFNPLAPEIQMASKRRIKIALIGAGSTVFARNLLGDILAYPELANSEIALYDIDEKRLGLSELVAQRVAAQLGVKPLIVA